MVEIIKKMHRGRKFPVVCDLSAAADSFCSGGQPEIEGKVRLAGATAGLSGWRACRAFRKFSEARGLLLEDEGPRAAIALDLEDERKLNGHSWMERGVKGRTPTAQTGKTNPTLPGTERQLATIDA